MLRLASALVLLLTVSAAHATQPDEDFFATRLDLLTTRFAHGESDFLPSYQLSASVLLARLPDASPSEFNLGGLSQLPSPLKPQQKVVPMPSAHWQQNYDSRRISLARLFRVEFKVAQTNVALRPNALTLEGEQFKITFRSHSALIEGEGMKLLLEPHSATMLWNKSF